MESCLKGVVRVLKLSRSDRALFGRPTWVYKARRFIFDAVKPQQLAAGM
jgi:hypothetical protein